MYVDESGADATDTTTDETQDVLTVEVGGEEYEVAENYDYDQDGSNDAAVVQTEDGYMAFSDSDGDGTADTAVQLDADGNVLAAAEYDETSGEWVEADPGSVAAPSGDGADDTGSTAPTSRDEDASPTATPAGSGGGGEILVDTPQGDVTAGAAQYDADGDGVNDTAVVTDESGATYAFTDVDGDGSADQAVVIEADGDVTVATHSGDNEWTTVETGHIGADGSYESDGTATPSAAAGDSVGATTGSDAAWQS
ncbi:DUF6802 family protein [Actinokineospora pegani]|uniref:DUF6802 family protein n=1 Tax=Actinokineospora pegani TaxID=2654637 RepID=UPI0018D275CF|nr:DUF6802 family protein [Actinokineospora pegani]